jgi:Fanconi anemia group M protein
MLATIALSYRIPALFTRNAKETASLFITIAKRQQSGSVHVYQPTSAKPSSTKELQEFMIGSIPGVGITLARALLEHFKSIDAVVQASIEDLQTIEKIGPVKAKAIHEFLHRQYIY